MGNTLDSQGFPVYAATPTQTVVDLQAAITAIRKYAFTLAGASSVRTTIPAGELRNGIRFHETDTDSEWVYNSGWKLWHRSWRAYSPTLTNVSGSPAVTARYAVAAGVVTVKVHLVLNGANIGTSPLIALPVTAAAATGKPVIGSAQYVDVSNSAYYFGAVNHESTTNAALIALLVSGAAIGSGANVTGAIPFAWAAGDIVTAQFSYEAA